MARTSIWNDERRRSASKWREGSLFSPPVNYLAPAFQRQRRQAARLLAVTSAPPMINFFRNLGFRPEQPVSFDDRFNRRPG